MRLIRFKIFLFGLIVLCGQWPSASEALQKSCNFRKQLFAIEIITALTYAGIISQPVTNSRLTKGTEETPTEVQKGFLAASFGSETGHSIRTSNSSELNERSFCVAFYKTTSSLSNETIIPIHGKSETLAKFQFNSMLKGHQCSQSPDVKREVSSAHFPIQIYLEYYFRYYPHIQGSWYSDFVKFTHSLALNGSRLPDCLLLFMQSVITNQLLLSDV